MKDGYYWLDDRPVLVEDDMVFELAQGPWIYNIPNIAGTPVEENFELIERKNDQAKD